MKTLIALLLITIATAQSYTISFQGWQQLPNTVDVPGYGEVIFSDVVFPTQLPTVPVAGQLPVFDPVVTPFDNPSAGLRMVQDGEMLVTFMGGNVWDLSALIAGPHGGLLDMEPLDGLPEFPGATQYKFTFTGVDDSVLVACNFVPEPSTSLLGLLGFMLILRRRR